MRPWFQNPMKRWDQGCKERRKHVIKEGRKEKRDSVHSNIPGILCYTSPEIFIEELTNINFLNLGAQHIIIKMLKEIR